MKTLSDLYVTTNVSNCERTKLEDWSRDKIVNLLKLTRLSVPDTWSHTRLSVALIHRLNIQLPPFYALDDGENVLLDSRNIIVKNQGEITGGIAKRLKVVSCELVWKEFLSYFSEVPNISSGNSCFKYKEEIVKLKKTIKKLEKQKISSNSHRLSKGLDECDNSIKFFQQRLDKTINNYAKAKDESRRKDLDNQELKVTILRLGVELEENRAKLSDNFERIADIQKLKQRISELERKL
jgi:hypothetical protein